MCRRWRAVTAPRYTCGILELERWTSLDRTLQLEAGEVGRAPIERFNEPWLQRQLLLLICRLQIYVKPVRPPVSPW